MAVSKTKTAAAPESRGGDVQSSDSRVDPVLLPLLHAAGETAIEKALSELITDHAIPVINDIVSYKLRSSFNRQDYDDVVSEVVFRLFKELQNFRAAPGERAPIANFRSYVARIAYNAWHDYLRSKYPQRHGLKTRLSYLLTHRRGLALWETDSPDLICGFAAWQGKKKPAPQDRWRQLRADPQAIVNFLPRGKNPARLSLADLVAEIFNFVDQPVELDELVNVVAGVLGIHDLPASQNESSDERSAAAALDDPPDQRPDAAKEFEQREFLRLVWEEIVLLPARQRVALLLNLKDSQGNGVTALPVLGIATMRQIAAALEMPVEDLARLWPDLPVDDLKIAGLLGCARQQVINYRKSARERLARRLGGVVAAG